MRKKILLFVSYLLLMSTGAWAQCEGNDCSGVTVDNDITTKQTQVQYGGSPRASAVSSPRIDNRDIVDNRDLVDNVNDNRDIVDNRDVNDNRHFNQNNIQGVGNPTLVYAPKSKTEVANFPVVPSGGFIANNGYHFPLNKAPHNIMGARELIRFKRVYTRQELLNMVSGKHFKVIPEPIKRQRPTEAISVFVMESLPPGKYTKILEVTALGKGEQETSVSCGAISALWAMAYGANVLLITRDGYDRFFQTKSSGQTASGVGAAINGAKDLAGGIAGLLGFNQLKSEHKARAFVNAVGLWWEPTKKKHTSMQSQAHQEVCNWLRKNDPLFDADLYNCQ